MISRIDEGQGLVKTYWEEIRDRVAAVEPEFTRLVDEISPDKSFPIYLAYYPYGAIQGDTKSPILPDQNGNYFRLSDPNIPKDLIDNLGYGKNNSPLAMVLEKEFEFFIDIAKNQITIPWAIYKPGTFFSLTPLLENKNERMYASNKVFSTTSGVRSTFMLPNIGCATNHSNLQRDFNIQLPPPKSLYEQWTIFKGITDSSATDCNWRSCVLFFSQKWIEKIHNDKIWLPLQLYFHKLACKYFEYERNFIYYKMTLSWIQEKRNLKPNPYLADTALHLLSISLGDVPGYRPAQDDEGLPIDTIQRAFTESYGLKKYSPILITPGHFNVEKDPFPIYYSLQAPSTIIASPKSRRISSTLLEMRELQHIMRVYVNELSQSNTVCFDTALNKIIEKIQFSYYHNLLDQHKVILLSEEIEKLDSRFSKPEYNDTYGFAKDASFLRGCVSISRKDQLLHLLE